MGLLEKARQAISLINEANNKAARAEGAKDAAMARLKELGYPSIKKAEAALDELEQTIEHHATELKAAITAFEDEYGDLDE